MQDMTLTWRTRVIPVFAGTLVLCLLALSSCGGHDAPPPPPPGLARIEDVPFEINTPPLRVKARIGPPFPDEPPSAADEVDAAMRDMGLDMSAAAPRNALSISAEWPDAEATGEPDAEAAASEMLEDEAKDADEAADADESPADIAGELAAIRSDVARMQAMLDLVLDEFVIELKNENNRLRAELDALQYERATRDRSGEEPLPRDAAEALARMRSAEPEETPTVHYDETAEPDGADEPIRYAIIKEWGREPEEAERLEGASALKGLICAVPPDATDAQLAELGRWLRQEYNAYENLNIDVFDDVAAARRFAETNRIEGGHRVLNISKHPATNRDVIALIREGGATVIPLTD